jgi:hypothetical protein
MGFAMESLLVEVGPNTKPVVASVPGACPRQIIAWPITFIFLCLIDANII